jgi:hypothetical protein
MLLGAIGFLYVGYVTVLLSRRRRWGPLLEQLRSMQK